MPKNEPLRGGGGEGTTAPRCTSQLPEGPRLLPGGYPLTQAVTLGAGYVPAYAPHSQTRW